VLKFKKGKTPRPIVVSPVRNRLVQRAILDVLQSSKPTLAKRLGDIPKVLATPTSVGGIPGRGSPEAVELIRLAIRDGATHYLRSDIKEFFTKVPVPEVLSYLRAQTHDDAFVRFVQGALAVELSNAEEPKVREWISLFPAGDIGVPQGSSLSALCANIVLREFDAEFNGRGIVTVRYIDDFVMLGQSERSLLRAWTAAEARLNKLGLEAHSPVPASAKASRGLVRDGFDFLSFRFHGNKVSPTRAAKQDLFAKIEKEFRDAHRTIQAQQNSPRRAEPRLVQVLGSVDCRIRGWGDAFKDVDQRLEFAQMDKEIRRIIDRFLRRFFGVQIGIVTPETMRAMGLALLADTPVTECEAPGDFSWRHKLADYPRDCADERHTGINSCRGELGELRRGGLHRVDVV
jgi:RNA-directed DNA polymerase